MDRDAWAGVALSFLVVGLVAVAFYQPDRPASRPARGRAAGPVVAPGPPLPAPTPGIPLVEASPPPPGPPPIPRPVRVAPARSSDAEPPRPIRTASRRPAPHRAPSAFASVAEGESLADVARRVYGTEAAIDELWRANRDQLDRPDAPVLAGMLLRTP